MHFDPTSFRQGAVAQVPYNSDPDLDDIDLRHEDGLAEIDTFYGRLSSSPQEETPTIPAHVEATQVQISQSRNTNEPEQVEASEASNDFDTLMEDLDNFPDAFLYAPADQDITRGAVAPPLSTNINAPPNHAIGSLATNAQQISDSPPPLAGDRLEGTMEFAKVSPVSAVPPSSGNRSQMQTEMRFEEEPPASPLPSPSKSSALYEHKVAAIANRSQMPNKPATSVSSEVDNRDQAEPLSDGAGRSIASEQPQTNVAKTSYAQQQPATSSFGTDPASVQVTMMPPPTTTSLKRIPSNTAETSPLHKKPKLSNEAGSIDASVNGPGNVYEDPISARMSHRETDSSVESDEEGAEEETVDHTKDPENVEGGLTEQDPTPASATKKKTTKRATGNSGEGSATATARRRSSTKVNTSSPETKRNTKAKRKGERDLKTLVGDTIKKDLDLKSSPRKTRNQRKAEEEGAPNAGAAAKKRHSLPVTKTK